MINLYQSQFDKAIYDTNCIIFYRFNFQEKLSGEMRSISHPFYDKIGKLTSRILNHNWKIYTIQMAWTEIENKGVAKIVEELLREMRLYTHIYGRRISEKLLKSLENLKSKNWFIIDNFFSSYNQLKRLREFYANLPDSDKKKRLIDKNKKPFPDDVDLSLIIYSSEIIGLLVSADHDICDFKYELEKNSLCPMILPLWEIN